VSLRTVKASELVRTDGEAAVQPDAETAAAMIAAGRTRVITSWAVVIDSSGWVEQVAAITSTGFVAYDVRIAAGIRAWRFQPFVDENGMAIAVATTYTFVWTP
jgi:hypothetical protein